MIEEVENIVYLLTGGNSGKREIYLKNALGLIEERIGKIITVSSVYETEPWGIKNQPVFLNQALCVKSFLKAEDMLVQIKDIEKTLGRTQSQKWNQREIDIDILLYNDSVIKKGSLIIPHPYFHERRFALTPLCEIAPEAIHPVLKKTINELLVSCNDASMVQLAGKFREFISKYKA